MSCFKLPNSLCKRIQSALTRFWWDNNSEQKKMCWISWKKLTKSTQIGGLGFRDIQKFNDALLTKVSWRILTKPECLLARVLLGKYSHSSHFLDSSTPNSASHGWRGIGIGREILKTHCGRVIGNGAATSVWYDPWLSLTKPQRPTGPAPENSKDMLVSELLIPGTTEWNVELIRRILPAYEEDILLLKPSKQGAIDKWAWLPTTSGTYTSKSGYYELQQDDINEQEVSQSITDFSWKSEIWALKCSSKTKMLLWKAMQNALPVGENLKQRNIKPDAKCPHCGEEESVLHLFFSCSFASQVWNQLPCKSTLSLTSISSFQQGLIATKTLTCLPPTGLGAGPLAPWIFWSIWNARNQKIFNQRQISPEEAVLQGILRAKEWQAAQPIEEATNRSQPQSKPIRSKTDSDITVCHTDAAWDEKTRSGGFGWTFADSRAGLRREGKAASSHVRSPLMAEAIAIRLALLHATELGITKLSVASDSKLLIEAINSEIPSKEIHGIHHDILSLSKSFLSISFSFVPREMNRKADSLAKLSLQNFIVSSS